MEMMSRSVLVLLCLSIVAPAFASPSFLHDFTSDGCSLFPDGTLQDRDKWCECCFDHDIAYWQGGTKQDRKNADATLRQCVEERTGNKKLATVMYDAVRAGGHPVFPTWYRWGYGWQYGRGYKPLTDDELAQVHQKLEMYHTSHPKGYCSEKHDVVK
jgi:hypothetical protein